MTAAPPEPPDGNESDPAGPRTEVEATGANEAEAVARLAELVEARISGS